MREASCGAHKWIEHVGEQKDRKCRMWAPNMRGHVGKQQGSQTRGPRTVGAPLSVQEGIPRRRGNRPSGDITLTPVSASTSSTAQGGPEMGRLGAHLGR